MGEDPIGFTSGDSNFYRYVLNSPNILRDPTGEKASCKKKIQLVLQAAVIFACKTFPNKCTASDSCFMLKIKKGIKYTCIGARTTINYICYKGGDKGHRDAIEQMRNGIRKCNKIYKKNKCDKKKCDGN